jgi:anti-anti-sigma factor
MFTAKKNRKGLCEVTLDGDLTIYEASELKSELDKCLNKCKAITINLSAVSELDTACFQVLLMAKRECVKKEIDFTMNSHSPAVFDVLELFNMESYFGDPVLV